MPFAHATDPVRPIHAGPWNLWAHRELDHAGKAIYRHIGHERWTRLHGGQSPVVPVHLIEDASGPYWGWQDSSKNHDKPTLIYSAQLLFEMCFASGSARAIEALASRGHTGKVIRLSIAEPLLD